MGDYGRGYRTEFLAYGTRGGDRKLEVVSGKAFSASQTYNLPRLPAPPRSPRTPPPAFPRRASGNRSSSGGLALSCFSDPEMKRRRRVASYKVYTVEGRVKASFRKGFRWIKGKYSELVHG